VDNGSTDGSPEFVKEFFPEVRVAHFGENMGFAKAANEGINIAKGELIAFLNNDAIADCIWIEELVKGLNSSKEIGLCASKILRAPEGAFIDTAGDQYTRYGVAIKRGHNAQANRFSKLEFVFGACAAAALYCKSMLNEIGYFDEDLYCIYEDVDLSFRAQLAGYKCLYIPTAIVYHNIGGTSGIENDFTLYYGQRNIDCVYLKNMPTSLLVKYLPIHFIYTILSLIYNLYHGKGKTYISSKIDAFRQIGLVLKKRKNIQNGRKVSSKYLQQIFDNRSLIRHKTKGN
jgi:GT2 family glycosyltransferase